MVSDLTGSPHIIHSEALGNLGISCWDHEVELTITLALTEITILNKSKQGVQILVGTRISSVCFNQATE